MNNKRICLVTSGHPPMDDRIFWKFSKSLAEAGYEVSILCSTESFDKKEPGIIIIGFDGYHLSKSEKIKRFSEHLHKIKPDLIICSEILPIISSLKNRQVNPSVKIILDITEWFPENVAFKLKGISRWLKYLQLFLPYTYLLQKVDHLIIGEKTKLARYNFLAPTKSKTIIGYYPVLKYFNCNPPDLTKKVIVLGYAGVITFERGIKTLLNVSKAIADKYPYKKIELLLFGKFTYPNEELEFKDLIKNLNNIEVQFEDWKDYDKMVAIIERMDLCFDLRIGNFIYKNSLPIKLFEYMACGKPFIFSDIKPIRDEIEFLNCGTLVDPQNENEIIKAAANYIDDPNIVNEHSKNARRIIENEKSWESESSKLLALVENLLS